jgi:MutS domain V
MTTTFSTTAEVKAEYERQLVRHETAGRDLYRRHVWTGNARVALFVAIAALAWRGHLYWMSAAIIAFVALLLVHRRILRDKKQAERAAEMYRLGIMRLEDRWPGTGDSGEQFRDPDHIYADDLDIFGPGGLFQLLCQARTRMGKETLARWLLHPAPLEAVRMRHEAVREFACKLDLRQDLALAGESGEVKADPARLRRWSETQVAFNDRFWLPCALLLAALSVAALVWAVVSFVRTGAEFWTPFLLTLMVNGAVLFSMRHPLEQLALNLDEAGHNLDALAAILHRLEGERFTSPLLQHLKQKLMSHGEPASRSIARLDTLCDLEDSLHNMFVRLINMPLLYSVLVACGLQRWRKQNSVAIAGWLEAIGEIEALASLGAYACEHPEDPFPEFAEGAPCFAGAALGHPLLPAEHCVRNDATLGGRSQVLLVSGSNMSGKSTLLRVVGINTVLAMMGAPVRAAGLRLSPASLGACMHISDSLRKGVSHFYAEIKRIRQVVDLSTQGTLIFLFDEMLQGTNSHDRRVGAEGILRTLISNGALGLVTTHDLALTSIAEVFPDRVANVHFQEKLEAGELSFDYRLRPGIVHTSNGVELMRSVGLEV